MASQHWGDFQQRIGIPLGGMAWNTASSPMPFEHFLDMERKLFSDLEVDEQVANFAISLVRETQTDFSDIRSGKARPFHFMHDTLRPFLKSLKESGEQGYAPTLDLGAIFTVISNSSVMFTTRDWGVAGTISTIAGALITAVAHRKS